MNPAVRAACGAVGIVTLVVVLDAAVRTFLLPRVASVRLSRGIGRAVSVVFRVLARPSQSYAVRDRVLAMYPPVLLLAYQAAWMVLTFVAFGLGFIATGAPTVAAAARLSGSSVFTLGISSGAGAAQLTLSFLEAGIGLTLLGLLIAFIPTIYQAFQRRETSVSRLSVRAGVPATPWGVLEIAESVGSSERLDNLWREWESWFIDVGETHTTLTILNYYRTPIRGQTWIASAATVLDAAALYNAAVDRPASPTAGLCIRAGWLCFRGLADYFSVPYPLHPDRSLPISVTRAEFDLACEHMAQSGVPLLADREAAWGDFVGWRVNYDAMVEAFSVLFTCPRTDWALAASQPRVGRSNLRGTK